MIEENTFKVGDWVIDNKRHDIRRITNVDEKFGMYWSISVNGTENLSNTIPYMNTNYHKWSIDDVKCGDILVSEYDSIFMTNGKIESLNNVTIGPAFICALSVDGNFYTIYDPFFEGSRPAPFTISSIPATYEERGKLFNSIVDNNWKLCADNMGNITGIER